MDIRINYGALSLDPENKAEASQLRELVRVMKTAAIKHYEIGPAVVVVTARYVRESQDLTAEQAATRKLCEG